MGRIAYVNGRFVAHARARVHIEDRGYQFADGVYEVCAVRGGTLLDEGLHWRRLERSLGELAIELPVTIPALKIIGRELLRRNRVENALLYVQVTRGVAPRDHAFPDARPAIVMTVKPMDHAKTIERAKAGVGVRTMPDLRWKRCDIKSVALLPNVLAKQAARCSGAFEAWLVDEQGCVTEGSSSNAWIVSNDGSIITRHLDHAILPGITRLRLVEIAAERQLKIVERAFTVREAQEAREAFLTSAGTFVMPVVEIDGQKIATGRPGEIASALREAYLGTH